MTDDVLGGPDFWSHRSSRFSAEGQAIEQCEQAAFANVRDINQESREREHTRHQTFRDNVNRAMIGIFWIASVMLGCGLMIYAWHLLTPLLWHFLDATQQARLETVLAPAVLSSALTGYVSRRIE